ncbi:MAG: hypothetical protein A2946_00955 [Candidatus Liptonbacteria bacterium RIFCSPLOWO2_01_FULL_53_13]|uniref:DUF2283 domain-containing protein n=1 Tax=Candidatus Liptonbacteria bacterium RIFCSPLOWO2_01_FULL_53_13 TaxID=1798651 RepID=A0A1G2CJP1_9BACT|nr:MAG: hypothetical protein A2946_00955 [Candidatus Liptonbacteria bacterium RIFCSPLOWO2_01_FULL_53_13]
MANGKNKLRIKYEPEADVLSWETNAGLISHAEEAGNVVVHFTKNNIPVLVEILEASTFLGNVRRLIEKGGAERKLAMIGR